jgi:hypothetical protein
LDEFPSVSVNVRIGIALIFLSFLALTMPTLNETGLDICDCLLAFYLSSGQGHG